MARDAVVTPLLRTVLRWAAVLGLLVLVLAGCSGPPKVDGIGARSSAPARSVALTGPATGAGCDRTVGSQLRERTTVDAAGAVTVLAGALACPGVGVWVSTFALDEDAAADPAPRFVGAYTGSGVLSARLPETRARCTASAVWFDVAATTASPAPGGAADVRGDLAAWPADRPPTVPAATILRGRPSPVLAARVSGDPATCSPGQNVATPVAAVGDCWSTTGSPSVTPSASSPSASSPSASSISGPSATTSDVQATGFRATACGAPHTHEVFWAEDLDPRAYQQQSATRPQPAAAWARGRAQQVCQDRRGSLRLAAGNRPGDVQLEVVWPAELQAPTAAGWPKAQVVCLARWRDGRTTATRLLAPNP